MALTLQLLLNGIQIGAVYVLFALGVNIIFGVMRIINFAHGEFFTLAALLVATFMAPLTVAMGMPVWLSYLASFTAALALVLAVALGIYFLALERYLRDEVGALIISLGVSMVLQGLYVMIFGVVPRGSNTIASGTSSILGASIANESLLILAVAVSATVLLYILTKHSKLGRALRAVTEDREAALLQGIKYRRIAMSGFLIGCALAAIAGALIVPTTLAQPAMGHDYLIKGFVVIIVGGLGSIPGTILAGFLIGMLESVTGFIWDLSIATIILFVTVIILLVIKPSGLLGRAQR